ncbi:hypothetical protein GA0115251_13301, partial [Streptomyces sp. TverLS-915]
MAPDRTAHGAGGADRTAAVHREADRTAVVREADRTAVVREADRTAVVLKADRTGVASEAGRTAGGQEAEEATWSVPPTMPFGTTERPRPRVARVLSGRPGA